MATVNILDPSSGTAKTITVSVDTSMVIQDLLGEIEFFVTLTTSARDANGSAIPKRTISSLTDGAGGTGLDRNGASLGGGAYANLSDAVNDYVAMMVNGVKDEPWTEMAF